MALAGVHPSTCTICESPLPPFPTAGPPLCAALSCRWRYQNLPRYHLCQVCGRLLSVADRSAGACSDRGCWITLNDQRRRIRQAELEAETAALCNSVARQFPQLRDQSIPITIIPAYKGTTARIPRRRRDALRRRLIRLVRQATDSAPAGPDSFASPLSDATAPAAQAACTNCRGVCCAGGNDHAYLTPQTIQRVQADHPELSGDQIVERYLSHLGPRSYAGSCIFHGSSGCGLPRAMRSDTCNNFFCSPMRDFLAAAALNPTAPAFLAAVDNHSVRAAVLFSGQQVTNVRSGQRPSSS